MKKNKGLINYKNALWGTYGPTGKDPLKYVRLIDCSTDHLKKIKIQCDLNQVISGIPHPYIKFINKIIKKRR